MARPTKLDDDMRDKVAALLRAGNLVDVAVLAAGIDRATHYRWMERGTKPGRRLKADEPFRVYATAVEEAMNHAEATAVALISRAARDDWRAAAWYLERAHPESWAKADRRRPAPIVVEADEVPLVEEDEFARLDELARVRQKRARRGKA